MTSSICRSSMRTPSSQTSTLSSWVTCSKTSTTSSDSSEPRSTSTSASTALHRHSAPRTCRTISASSRCWSTWSPIRSNSRSAEASESRSESCSGTEPVSWSSRSRTPAWGSAERTSRGCSSSSGCSPSTGAGWTSRAAALDSRSRSESLRVLEGKSKSHQGRTS